jgi:hypothetical protein
MRDARAASISGIVLGFLAIVGGMMGAFVYGALSHTVSAKTESPTLIRAAAVELIDNAGNRVAVLGTDERQNTSLAFFDARGKKRAEFGLGRGENPRLDINGPEGDSLLSLDLGQQARPRLMLSDHDFNGRVYLGVVEPDAPSPGWKYDTWVLRFRGDRGQPLATIGMTTRGAGGVVVFDQSGHQWRTPLKE